MQEGGLKQRVKGVLLLTFKFLSLNNTAVQFVAYQNVTIFWDHLKKNLFIIYSPTSNPRLALSPDLNSMYIQKMMHVFFIIAGHN